MQREDRKHTHKVRHPICMDWRMEQVDIEDHSKS
jgi:hypothetical protein